MQLGLSKKEVQEADSFREQLPTQSHSNRPSPIWTGQYGSSNPFALGLGQQAWLLYL